MSKNQLLQHNQLKDDYDEDAELSKRRTISIDYSTWLRLGKRGIFGDSYNSVLVKLLDETEKRELPEGEHSN